MTVPSDRNIALKQTEKKCKYKDLELEIQRMWHMKTVVIPVVVGALGTVKKGMVENIKKVSERANMTEIQKICMLGSARILRKVLSVSLHGSSVFGHQQAISSWGRLLLFNSFRMS